MAVWIATDLPSEFYYIVILFMLHTFVDIVVVEIYT